MDLHVLHRTYPQAHPGKNKSPKTHQHTMWSGCMLRASMLTNLHISECPDVCSEHGFSQEKCKSAVRFWSPFHIFDRLESEPCLRVLCERLFFPSRLLNTMLAPTPTWTEQTWPKAFPSAPTLAPAHTLLNSKILCPGHFYHSICCVSTQSTYTDLLYCKYGCTSITFLHDFWEIFGIPWGNMPILGAKWATYIVVINQGVWKHLNLLCLY